MKHDVMVYWQNVVINQVCLQAYYDGKNAAEIAIGECATV